MWPSTRARIGCALVLAVLALVLGTSPAGAGCSSFPPVAVLFEGHAVARTESEGSIYQPSFPLYRWKVDKALHGVADGAEIVIYLGVYDDPNHRMSGDIGPAPFLGPRYRVGAYRGGEPATHLLFTNDCGGELTLLEAPPSTVATRPPGPLDAQGSSLPGGLVVGLGVAVVSAALAGFLVSTRRRAR